MPHTNRAPVLLSFLLVLLAQIVVQPTSLGAEPTGVARKGADPVARPLASEDDAGELRQAGIGLRLGISTLSLAPSGLPVNGADMVVGDLKQHVMVVTPTVHLGGDGSFFKLDVPIAMNGRDRTVGVGIYPINYGYLFRRAGLFPYFSAGAVASVIVSGKNAEGTPRKGAFGQVRGAAGVKFRKLRGLALSVEVGYSRWAAGMVMDQAVGQSVLDRDMRGGVGQGIDLSAGIELL